jgi:hypothetical protein
VPVGTLPLQQAGLAEATEDTAWIDRDEGSGAVESCCQYGSMGAHASRAVDVARANRVGLKALVAARLGSG